MVIDLLDGKKIECDLIYISPEGKIYADREEVATLNDLYEIRSLW